MICPNCGDDANFQEHTESFVETHGLDCGPYETWTETWLTCNACGSKTDDAELRAANDEWYAEPEGFERMVPAGSTTRSKR